MKKTNWLQLIKLLGKSILEIGILAVIFIPILVILVHLFIDLAVVVWNIW